MEQGHSNARKSKEKGKPDKKLLFRLGITKSHRKGIHLSNKIKKKISISQAKRLKQHPELKKKHSVYMKEYWKRHPEIVEQHKKYLIELWKSPEKREKARKTATEVYKNHPNLKEASRKRFIAWLIKHKEAMKYIEQGKGNKKQLSRLTLKHEKVRSLYEVMVANWLYKHEIAYFYEGKMLVFPDFSKLRISFAVPDFFLPEYNCIIEIYGQFRQSRSRTIKKNNAYRKYGIPFLAITPSTINDLDSIIPEFLKQIGKNPKLTKEARSILWGMLD